MQRMVVFSKFIDKKLFYKVRKMFCLFLFYNVYKEKTFTIEIEDGREAP